MQIAPEKKARLRYRTFTIGTGQAWLAKTTAACRFGSKRARIAFVYYGMTGMFCSATTLNER